MIRELPATENLPKGYGNGEGSQDVTFSVDPKGKAVVFAKQNPESVHFFLVCAILDFRF
jgi:hypothetical protein